MAGCVTFRFKCDYLWKRRWEEAIGVNWSVFNHTGKNHCPCVIGFFFFAILVLYRLTETVGIEPRHCNWLLMQLKSDIVAYKTLFEWNATSIISQHLPFSTMALLNWRHHLYYPWQKPGLSFPIMFSKSSIIYLNYFTACNNRFDEIIDMNVETSSKLYSQAHSAEYAGRLSRSASSNAALWMHCEAE